MPGLPLRCLACIVWLLSVAAAPPKERPRVPPLPNERILALPLEEALAKARKVLQRRGLTLEEGPPGQPLRTAWSPTYVGLRNFVRYVVTGSRVDARRSIIRIFQVASPAEGGGSVPANVMRMRDAELERLLAASLPPGAVTEAVEGRIPLSPAQPLARAPDFYLDRWTLEGTGGLADRIDCGRYVVELRLLLRSSRALLIGGRPGSWEVPEAMRNMVCETSESAMEVALGLPIPATEQERIDRYLTSLGAPADQDALLRGGFWTGPAQDGWASRAMLDLLDQMRALRAAGLSIAVVAYDPGETPGAGRGARMAEVWARRRAKGSGELFLVLADMAHARQSRGTSKAPDFVPMALHLAKTEPLLRSFQLDILPAPPRTECVRRMSSDLLSCDLVSPLPSARGVNPPPYELFSARLFPEPEAGFHGVVDVRRSTPSVPAVFDGPEPPSREPAGPPVPRPRRELKVH